MMTEQNAESARTTAALVLHEHRQDFLAVEQLLAMTTVDDLRALVRLAHHYVVGHHEEPDQFLQRVIAAATPGQVAG